MANDSMELFDWLCKVASEGDADFLREGVRMLAQALMEFELSELAGASHGERSPEPQLRNGYGDRLWDTKVGAVELKIPKLREGSYLSSLLEPRRRVDRAMVAVIQEVYVKGVSTRKVDDIVRTLGMTGISKSAVSRICAELDEMVAEFLTGELAGPYPYAGSMPPSTRCGRPAASSPWRPWKGRCQHPPGARCSGSTYCDLRSE